MKHTMALAGAWLLLLSHGAQAQSGETYQPSGLRPFIGVGFTSGGDTLIPVTLTPEGSTVQYREHVSSGGGLDLRVGVSRRLGTLPLSLQVAGAYHNDQVNGIKGEKVRFRRMPIEATLMWHATDRTRIGFGVRKATHPVFKADNVTCGTESGATVNCSGKATLKSNVGVILEAEYALTPGWGLKARYVWESYRIKQATPAWIPGIVEQEEKFEANHLGLLSVWYFD